MAVAIVSIELFLVLFSFFPVSDGQASFGVVDKTAALQKGILTLGTELDGDAGAPTDDTDEDNPDVDYTDDVLVIPNDFPEKLTRICYPRTRLQRDRFCIGGLDAFALACAAGRPPLQLAPFCQGFDDLCESVNFPDDSWCEKDFSLYSRHCAYIGRPVCRNCTFDDCSCEPYDCVARRSGVRTAEWCQRYELFCNATARRDEAERLVAVMENSVRLHAHCYNLFNLAKTICNPFRPKYDFKRCQKFLLDCELISDFREYDAEEEFVKQAEEAAKGIPLNTAKDLASEGSGKGPEVKGSVPPKDMTASSNSTVSTPTMEPSPKQRSNATTPAGPPTTNSTVPPSKNPVKNPFAYLLHRYRNLS